MIPTPINVNTMGIRNSGLATTISATEAIQPVAAVKNNKVMNVDFAVFERQSPRMFEALREMGKFAAV